GCISVRQGPGKSSMQVGSAMSIRQACRRRLNVRRRHNRLIPPCCTHSSARTRRSMWTDQSNDQPVSRRRMLLQCGSGFGALALAGLLPHDGHATTEGALSPLATKLTHHPSQARSVIFLFMDGGPSHLDTFDPKPALDKLAGKPIPESFGRVITAMGEFDSPILPSARKWKQHGESGLWVSDWLPHTAQMADELAVIRSCWTNGINHSGGICQMNTGSQFAGRPSLGSWVTYGLGTENENLPAFVVMQEGAGRVINGARNWGAGFMPAVYQGTTMAKEGPPFANLSPPKHVTTVQQRRELDLLARL